MIPDPSIPSNYPEHIECYSLPHIIIDQQQFWGKSQTGHITTAPGYPHDVPSSYCYTTVGNIFCCFTPQQNLIVLMSLKRYRCHQWILKYDYELVWDSNNSKCFDHIKSKITSASQFKIAMLDQENIWNIHPVDLPMLYPEDNKFSLKIMYDSYPTFFRNFKELNQLYTNNIDYFDQKPDSNKTGVKPFKTEFSPIFYDIFSDGTYMGVNDIDQNRRRQYKQLKVFAEIDA